MPIGGSYVSLATAAIRGGAPTPLPDYFRSTRAMRSSVSAVHSLRDLTNLQPCLDFACLRTAIYVRSPARTRRFFEARTRTSSLARDSLALLPVPDGFYTAYVRGIFWYFLPILEA